MRLRHGALFVAATFLLIACLSNAAPCVYDRAACSPVAPDRSLTVIAQSLEAMIGILALAWLFRFLFLAARADSAIGQLPRIRTPNSIQAAAVGASLKSVYCFESSTPIAFCAGLLRPVVYISTSAVAHLSRPELAAVLHHEAHHSRTYEPLRRLSASAAADVLGFVPLVSWWAEYRRQRAELHADAAAVRAVGRAATAGALLALTDSRLGISGFGDCAELRAHYLLTGKIGPQRHPSLSKVTTSASAMLFAFSLTGCLWELARVLA